ncbi:PREDICTED: uncharacterized protein C15orf61 homolog isoform X2 [Rhagoletis zephyria]|uniref:uncharacterized protein C15orf61 homolog isoform X2 n=1 Tax=Rhagoletis zephyria TaxID=28612 RepID=UPI0008115719|nr:PREDICTED: uncharacterized protein C15orf61 homolog isoform X2 [Rhagoletis zephyria]XP_036323068.1 uncharacterized protein C15orf61 homolog isoform X2 [Rhagoletis pomonella]
MRLTAILLKPKASEVLTAYLKQCSEPPWTSYFFKDVENDQRGWSHFNWTLDTGTNYHILRTGCYPYMKYHCSKRAIQDLSLEDRFFRVLKVINLGLPMLFYGLAAIHLITHEELVHLPNGSRIPIYFLYAEDKGSMH